jgi:hypothetical protein
VGFQPQRDFAQFHGQRIQVHTIDALTDYMANGSTKGSWGGLFFAGANDGKFGGDARRAAANRM